MGADPALIGFREKVGDVIRYAEIVAENERAAPEDRQMAAQVVRQGKGLWRQLDRWRRQHVARAS